MKNKLLILTFKGVSGVARAVLLEHVSKSLIAMGFRCSDPPSWANNAAALQVNNIQYDWKDIQSWREWTNADEAYCQSCEAVICHASTHLEQFLCAARDLFETKKEYVEYINDTKCTIGQNEVAIDFTEILKKVQERALTARRHYFGDKAAEDITIRHVSK